MQIHYVELVNREMSVDSFCDLFTVSYVTLEKGGQ